MQEFANLRISIMNLADTICQVLGSAMVEHVFLMYGIKDINTAPVSSLWDAFNELDAIAADLN